MGCSPRVSNIDVGGECVIKERRLLSITCRINYTLSEDHEINNLKPGFCWAEMKPSSGLGLSDSLS